MGEKETLVLIGSNGSGKSTVINMIVGFQRADKGDIVLGGTKSIWEARGKIRLCQQHDFLFDTLTFREHLELTCKLRNIKKVLENTIIIDLSEVFSLSLLLDKRVDQLSAGNRRLISIAMALIGEA